MKPVNQQTNDATGNYPGTRQYMNATALTFSISKFEENELIGQEQEYGRLHRHPHFEAIWKTGGSGICVIDDRRYEMNDDTIYFITPGQLHLLQTDADASGYVIRFCKEFIHLTADIKGNNLYSDMILNPTIFKIEKEVEKKDFENILSSIFTEFSRYSILRSDIISGWLRVFLAYLKNLAPPFELASKHPGNSILVQKFYSLLEKDFLKRKMVMDYADELFVSPSHLNEIIKRASGFTASYHIQQRIVLEAKRLAIYSGSNMKEIAYLLGYDDTAHFSKFFKAYSGTNFRDFKRSRSVCAA